ncbi:MAG: hypothetical protein AB7T63_02305 [Planctomycetota bacterium]
MASDLSRRRFLRWAAAAGIVVPALASMEGVTRAWGAPDGDAPSLGDDLLAQGLAALAHAHHRGWARGHHGAAVIAAWCFQREHALDERTTAALRKQVEAFIASRRSEFPPPAPGSGTAHPELLLEKLAEHVHELRSGGHDAIHTALALRALRQLPEYATPRILDGLVKLLEGFVTMLPVEPVSDFHREHPLAPYANADAIRQVTLAALLRPWRHIRSEGAGVVVHWVTHGEALVTLHEMGYDQVARLGHPAHQQFLNRPVGPDDLEEPEGEPIAWLQPGYWESDAPRTPQKGTWFFGHSFKLPFSLFRLLAGTTDGALGTRALVRAAQLHVPFE